MTTYIRHWLPERLVTRDQSMAGMDLRRKPLELIGLELLHRRHP